MNKTPRIVINPMTQRPIKTNGRVYKKLLNEGYFSDTTNNTNNPNTGYKLKEETTYNNDDSEKEETTYNNDDS